MPEGDLIDREYQMEFWRSDADRLLIGANTNYHILEMQGLGVMPIRDQDFERQGDHGDYAAVPEFMPARNLNGKLVVKGTSNADMVSKLDALARVFRPSSKDVVCTLRWMGRDKMRLLGRPRRAEWEYDASFVHGGAMQVVTQFKAQDPIIYEHILRSQQITVGDGATTETATMTNFGSIGVWPTLRIVGPARNPRITNVTADNKQVKLDLLLGAADVLDIDVARRTVKLNGAHRYDLVRRDNQWWRMLGGPNTITYSRTNTNGSSILTVSYRSGWAGI